MTKVELERRSVQASRDMLRNAHSSHGMAGFLREWQLRIDRITTIYLESLIYSICESMEIGVLSS